jgi:hypothetical protein
MNSLEDTAPLTLLTNMEATKLAENLRLLTATTGEMKLTQMGAVSGNTFEVVYCGVTFIISISLENGNFSGLKEIFCGFDPLQIQSGLNIALSAHVAGGERVPAIIRTLLELAQKLGCSCQAVATVWRPAVIVSGFEYFEPVVRGYLTGGAFPVLAMVNFKSRPEGVITTNGLGTLSGQELQIECGTMDQADVMQRVVRVAHDLAVNGPVNEQLSLDGMDVGEKLKLEPSSGAALLKVTIEFVLDG